MEVIKNAMISSVDFNTERGFTIFVNLDYGDGGQSFGGHALYNDEKWRTQSNYVGRFIKRLFDIAGTNSWDSFSGQTVRVKLPEGESGTIRALGHIIKDDWFDPQEEFKPK